MPDIDYRKFAADIIKTMLPIVYRETPEVGNMVGNRGRRALNRTMELAELAIEELKDLKI